MSVIEIQTIEGGRLEWVAIYSDTINERAIRWGTELLSGFRDQRLQPKLRIARWANGPVIGAWQREGYEEVTA